MKQLYIFISGFLIGIANVIPGLSGATVAISLGIYEKIINALATLRQNFIANCSFLIILFFGAVAGILLLSKGIAISFEKYQIWLVCFFIGLILGGIPAIFKKTNQKFTWQNILSFLIAFIIILSLGLVEFNREIMVENLNFFDYFKIALAGFIGSSAMIIPGISGALILMIIGYYNYIIEAINNLTNQNEFINSVIILAIFGLGIIIGLFSLAKMIKYFLLKHQNITYFAVLGIILASVIIIFVPLLTHQVVFYQAVTALLLIDLGFIITFILGDRS